MESAIGNGRELEQTELLAAGLEARLARIEELLGELHGWMRSEQIESLSAPYRRLFAQLLANDFDRRYATSLVRSVHQAVGASEPTESHLQATAAEEIDRGLGRHADPLASLTPEEGRGRPYIIALVGSSGAGKTTMMYKLAVRAVLSRDLRVKIISCDTYKIGSVEGVQTIAEILSIPFGIAFEPGEVGRQIDEAEADLVIVDTAGRSDRGAREELAAFLEAARPDETHLVLSATMGQRALQETAALFLGERLSCVSFTKLDEAPTMGNIVSAAHWMDLPLGYLSTGTVIPDDLVPAADAPVGRWSVEGLPVASHQMEGRHV